MKISSNFDGGNIRTIDCTICSNIQLEIKNDTQSDFYQWFYFRLSGAAGEQCQLNIINAGGAAYTGGWENYKAVASYDREHWFRVPTSFVKNTLSIDYTPQYDSIYFAYFAPYSMERHADLIADAQLCDQVSLDVLGSTLDGQDMDLLIIGEDTVNRKKIWMIGRQHPGETMAEWFIEGFLNRLLDPSDAVARALLEKAVFYVVPNMNPDGSRRGHLRTNAKGVNLNREWNDATIENSPEVYLVRDRMRQTGVDFCLDVHGDEALPHNFIAGSEGIPSWNVHRKTLLDEYKSTLQNLSPDFQTESGYPESKTGQANLKMCCNYVAESFNCLSMTFEMPFKDTTANCEEIQGWSPERSSIIGAVNLDAIHLIFNKL